MNFLKNLAALLLVVLVICGAVGLLLLPAVLGEWLGNWATIATFVVYFLSIAAAATWADQK